MAYREVTMLEVKEVLRLWLSGIHKKRIAAQLGLNIKTVRRRTSPPRGPAAVYALLGLVPRYGDARVDDACATALAAEMLSVRRLARLLELASPTPIRAAGPGAPALAQYLRPATHYALPHPARDEGDPV